MCVNLSARLPQQQRSRIAHNRAPFVGIGRRCTRCSQHRFQLPMRRVAEPIWGLPSQGRQIELLAQKHWGGRAGVTKGGAASGAVARECFSSPLRYGLRLVAPLRLSLLTLGDQPPRRACLNVMWAASKLAGTDHRCVRQTSGMAARNGADAYSFLQSGQQGLPGRHSALDGPGLLQRSVWNMWWSWLLQAPRRFAPVLYASHFAHWPEVSVAGGRCVRPAWRC